MLINCVPGVNIFNIGLEALSGYIWANGIAISKLGCGLGGVHGKKE